LIFADLRNSFVVAKCSTVVILGSPALSPYSSNLYSLSQSLRVCDHGIIYGTRLRSLRLTPSSSSSNRKLIYLGSLCAREGNRPSRREPSIFLPSSGMTRKPKTSYVYISRAKCIEPLTIAGPCRQRNRLRNRYAERRCCLKHDEGRHPATSGGPSGHRW